MRQNRHIFGKLNFKKQLFQLDWHDMVRRLHQYKPRVAQGKKMAGFQAVDEIGRDVIVGARNKLQRDTGGIQLQLQRLNGGANLSSGVIVQARQNMRRASNALDALFYIVAGHIQRYGEISSTVIEPRQNVTMQINHERRLPALLAYITGP